MHVILENDMQKQLKMLAISLAAPKSALSRHIAGQPLNLHSLATSLANINAALSPHIAA